MSDWKPIDTVPKDGTFVLLMIQYEDAPVVAEFSHGRWWARIDNDAVSCGPCCQPTHWMPLPEPPK